ncbi:MAG: type II toxin-antitoxin system RelE/ParE family toxin [Reichenbachiella sp.]|uniref:type II toxin-antitoxin system RelE/ParE family toxin n=1 Tax=Reichenbachiella sp. TaxID=2184521 RepID=UPI002966068B|nr:type II toxin-antitoxin system RelE/ParE family toxin [Reichenbachiella sp.]MDW3209692.1 type II toxin-antitoxin system RelE/ParE family toxin [Reichenbachiella sp.]
MKKVIWSLTARKSLRRTSAFISELWNEQVKMEFLNQLNFRVDQIRKNPELAPTFEDSEVRKLVIHKSVTLYYQNLPEHLRLLLVWDNRQDPAKLYQELTDAN